ncbi:MAG: hypothetical protein MJ252_00275 [archaeon]|nr:hypothetical protein [archaeon]
MEKTEEEKIDELVSILEKKPRERKQNEKLAIEDYFYSTNIKEEFKPDLLYTGYTIEKMIRMICNHIATVTYPKGDSIFYEKNQNDYAYIQLKGKIGLYSLEGEKKMMSSVEYYTFLKSFYEAGESFLLSRTIEANKEIYPVSSMNDTKDFDQIIFNVKLNKLAAKGEIEEITKLINEYGKKPEDIDFHRVLNGEDIIEEFYESIKIKLKENEQFYYNIIGNDKKEVTIIKFSLIQSLENNDYFGNFDLKDVGGQRKYSAIADETSLLLRIKKKDYANIIEMDLKSQNDKEIDRLYNSTFFRFMRKKIFAKNFFPSFKLVEFNKGDYLYKEGDEIEYIYFSKGGFFEVIMPNKSILDLKTEISKLKNLDDSFIKEFDDVFPLQNKPALLMPLLKEKRNFSLFKSQTEIYGVYELMYGIKSIYNVLTVSDKAKAYKLSVEALLGKRKEDGALLKLGLEKEATSKAKAVLERLIMLKNFSLNKLDFDYSKTSLENEKIYNKQLRDAMPVPNKVDNLRNSYFISDDKFMSKIFNKKNFVRNKNDSKGKKRMTIRNATILSSPIVAGEIMRNKNIFSRDKFKIKETIRNTSPIPELELSPSKSSQTNKSPEISLIKHKIKMIPEKKETSVNTSNFITYHNMLPDESQNDPSKMIILPMVSVRGLKYDASPKMKKRSKRVFNTELNDNYKQSVVNSIDYFDEDISASQKQLNYLVIKKFYDNLPNQKMNMLKSQK